MGETIEMIGKSQAWNLLWKEEAVQELWKKAREAYEEDKEGWGDIKKFLKEPANQELPALLADAGSQEIFLYLGNGWADVLGFFLEVANSAVLTNLLSMWTA